MVPLLAPLGCCGKQRKRPLLAMVGNGFVPHTNGVNLKHSNNIQPISPIAPSFFNATRFVYFVTGP
jgi:hypothetical protein